MSISGIRIVRNSMTILFVLGFAVAAFAGGPKSSPIAPNVIIILVDDMGYGDLESYGAQPYRTPNLNSLASQGITKTRGSGVRPVVIVKQD